MIGGGVVELSWQAERGWVGSPNDDLVVRGVASYEAGYSRAFDGVQHNLLSAFQCGAYVVEG